MTIDAEFEQIQQRLMNGKAKRGAGRETRASVKGRMATGKKTK